MEEKYRDIVNCCTAYSIISELVESGTKNTYSAAVGQLENISRRFEKYEETKNCDKKIKNLITLLKENGVDGKKVLKLEEEISKEVESIKNKLVNPYSAASGLAWQSNLGGSRIVPPK